MLISKLTANKAPEGPGKLYPILEATLLTAQVASSKQHPAEKEFVDKNAKGKIFDMGIHLEDIKVIFILFHGKRRIFFA